MDGMKSIKMFFMALLALGTTVSCTEDDLVVSNRSVVAGGISVEAEKSQQAMDRLASSLTWNGAEVIARVDNRNGLEVFEYGVYYSVVSGFSIGQATKVSSTNFGNVEGFTPGHFSVALSGLNDGTKFYYRFYIKHAGGISYSELSEAENFTTKLNYRTPEVRITSSNVITKKLIECEIAHHGNYEITACGIYFGADAAQMKKIPAGSWSMDGVTGRFVIDLTAEDIVREDSYYYKAYAINQAGEGVGELTQIILEKERIFAKLSSSVQVLSKTSALLTVTVEQIGYGDISDYGYYLNGKKTSVGTNPLIVGDFYTATINGLTMGKENSLYAYAINADGENPKPDEPLLFTSGIPGKNQSDKHLIYLELPGVSDGGNTYYFLDRNLGAIDAYETGTEPSVSTDAGSAFQWGRSGDGHQLWEKAPVQVAGGAAYPLESKYVGLFIGNASGYKWTPSLKGLSNLWDNSESGGLNNPCPEDYRIPTKDEMMAFINNKSKMFAASTLLFRTASSGAVNKTNGFYWTSTLEVANSYPYQIHVSTNVASVNSSYGQGNFIRCMRVGK